MRPCRPPELGSVLLRAERLQPNIATFQQSWAGKRDGFPLGQVLCFQHELSVSVALIAPLTVGKKVKPRFSTFCPISHSRNTSNAPLMRLVPTPSPLYS